MHWQGTSKASSKAVEAGLRREQPRPRQQVMARSKDGTSECETSEYSYKRIRQGIRLDEITIEKPYSTNGPLARARIQVDAKQPRDHCICFFTFDA